jgi:hypothetical protein
MIEERKLTDSEKEAKESYLKRFKKKDRFKDSKGKLNSLAYAIATKHSKAGKKPPPKIKEAMGSLAEAKKKKKDDPCWDGYKQVGMKTKNGKKVPNCVPESSETTSNDIPIRSKMVGPKKKKEPIKELTNVERKYLLALIDEAHKDLSGSSTAQ